MGFVAWPEIDNFHTLRRTLKKYPELLAGAHEVRYKCKVKLHGTNAGVIVKSNGQVIAQSRTQVITPGNDNMGFAKWVEDRADAFSATSHALGDAIIYGEWCGPGIQKGVAISSIEKKIFAVFAIRHVWGDCESLVVDPELIGRAVKDIPDVYVLQWYDFDVNIRWNDEDETHLNDVVERINAHVKDVETCDPWVKKTFDVDGVGEGLVFYPIGRHSGFTNFKNLIFKAKGEKHQVVAKTKAAQVDPTIAAGAQEFAQLVVTPSRCEQGCRQVNGGELIFDMKNMGSFLKWMAGDVSKECEAELETSRVDRKLAMKECSDLARRWYIENSKEVGHG